MIFKPLKDRIIAKVEKASKTSESGIYLGDGGSAEQPRLATAVAVGKDVEEIKVGHRFLYQAFAAMAFKVGEEEFISTREEFVESLVETEITK
jgi:co-chaperonin GroES (HSP10)